MSPDKFGIMAAVVVASLILSRAGEHAQAWPSAVQALLLLLSLAGVIISQTRAVYLTILMALGLSLCFLRFPRALVRWVGSVRVSWLVTVGYALFLILANVIFPRIAPADLIDVGSAQSVRNVVVRIESNALIWQTLRQAPIMGIGHGRFQSLAFSLASIHNHFGEQIVSTGLVGGLPYLLFHLWVLAQALQLLGLVSDSVQPLARTLVVSVLSIYFTFQFFSGFFVSTLAVVVGLIVSLRAQHKSSRLVQSLAAG
jgi:O-antigen ligase